MNSSFKSGLAIVSSLPDSIANFDPYYGDIKRYFLKINKQEYLNSSEIYSKLSDKEIVVLNHWEKFYPRMFN